MTSSTDVLQLVGRHQTDINMYARLLFREELHTAFLERKKKK